MWGNRRVWMVLGAAIVVLAGACSGGDPPEEAGQPADGSGVAQAGKIGLAVSTPQVVQAESGLFPTTATDARSGAVYVAYARELPGPEGHDEDPLVEAVVARSDDGGKTFGAPVVVSPPGMAVHTRSVSPTEVEVGPEGEVYVLFKHVEGLENYGSARRQMHLVRSDDGGKTFSAPVDVASEAVEGVVSSMDMLDLFIAPDGDVFVSFLDSREKIAKALASAGAKEPDHSGHGATEEREINTMRVSRSADGGRTFAKSTLVAQDVCVCCGTKVAQGGAGDAPVFVTTRSEWMEFKDSKDAVRDPFLSVSGDEGQTWSKATKIHDDRFKVSSCPDVNAGLEVDSKGRLHAAWYTGTDRGPGVYYARSEDDGKNFSEPVALLTDDWIPYGDVVMAIDRDDVAWVAYEDRRSDVDQIQVVRVGPDGELTYSESWPGNTPDLGVGDDGIRVVWSGAADEEEEAAGPIKFAAVTLGGDEAAAGH
ncbi:MAG: sialidase family protein [Acidimicrobiia bacterium]